MEYGIYRVIYIIHLIVMQYSIKKKSGFRKLDFLALEYAVYTYSILNTLYGLSKN